MKGASDEGERAGRAVVTASGEEPIFQAGEQVRIANLSPVGHYRVPTYLRDKTGWIEAVIEPRGIDNEEEAYGRNAGQKLHYYRVAFAMTEIWGDYAGAPGDGLRIEVYETWLERI